MIHLYGIDCVVCGFPAAAYDHATGQVRHESSYAPMSCFIPRFGKDEK